MSSRILLMHPILDPGPSILAEAGEVVAYPANRPLDEASIRQAAEGCVGIVSQLMDPIRDTVLSTPGLKCVSNVAVGFDNIDVPAATTRKVRSEERRVGKEGRAGWAPDNDKTTNKHR